MSSIPKKTFTDLMEGLFTRSEESLLEPVINLKCKSLNLSGLCGFDDVLVCAASDCISMTYA